MDREHLMALRASLQLSWVTAMMYAATSDVERDTPAMLEKTDNDWELNSLENNSVNIETYMRYGYHRFTTTGYLVGTLVYFVTPSPNHTLSSPGSSPTCYPLLPRPCTGRFRDSYVTQCILCNTMFSLPGFKRSKCMVVYSTLHVLCNRPDPLALGLPLLKFITNTEGHASCLKTLMQLRSQSKNLTWESSAINRMQHLSSHLVVKSGLTYSPKQFTKFSKNPRILT